MNSARFVTLTLAEDGRGLKARLDALSKAFRKLRADPWFKENCTGGVYGIETTRGRDRGHWHVHLHIIAEGDYMDQATLSRAWAKASGGSIIVHIKAVHDRSTAARYISQYVSKPCDVTGWQPKHVAEFALAMHGRRLLHTFGSLHGVSVEEPREKCGGKPTKFLVHAESLREAAAADSEGARHALEIASRLGPLWCGALGLKAAAAAAGLEPVQEWELDLLVRVCTELNRQLYEQPPPDAPADAAAPATPWQTRQREQLSLLPV